jgi:hypothetical protein
MCDYFAGKGTGRLDMPSQVLPVVASMAERTENTCHHFYRYRDQPQREDGCYDSYYD